MHCLPSFNVKRTHYYMLLRPISVDKNVRHISPRLCLSLAKKPLKYSGTSEYVVHCKMSVDFKVNDRQLAAKAFTVTFTGDRKTFIGMWLWEKVEVGRHVYFVAANNASLPFVTLPWSFRSCHAR